MPFFNKVFSLIYLFDIPKYIYLKNSCQYVLKYEFH